MLSIEFTHKVVRLHNAKATFLLQSLLDQRYTSTSEVVEGPGSQPQTFSSTCAQIVRQRACS